MGIEKLSDFFYSAKNMLSLLGRFGFIPEKRDWIIKNISFCIRIIRICFLELDSLRY